MRVLKQARNKALVVSLLLTTSLAGASASWAETITEALALAYSGNPTLNAQRAAVRATDENVPLAKSGLRPFIEGNAYKGRTHTKTFSPLGTTTTDLTPYGFGVTISQVLWDSWKTQNNVAAAESGVLAQRETLRNTEQNVLFDAATACMDVIRDTQIASYRASALSFLDELVRSERARFDVGESTRTDTAQAQAQQAGARGLASAAKAQLKSSQAIYRQIVGKEPGKLTMPKAAVAKIPSSLDQALQIAYAQHPAILATRHLVDVAMYNVKSAESSFLPTISLQGKLSKDYDVAKNTDRESASIMANLNIPIYQGGKASATVRQNKETLGQRRIEVDQAVDNVRAAVVSAYSQLEAARASAEGYDAQLRAAQIALNGVQEERRVGQRTTLDVLNTQSDVLDAQILLAQSRRNVVVASYAVLSAIGRLTADDLSLKVARYDPEDHYVVVKDKWYGLRTPTGE